MYVLAFGWCGQTCVNGKLSPSLRLQSISNLLVKHRLTILIQVWPQPKSTHERKLLKKNGIHHKSSKYIVSSFLVCVQPTPLPQKKKKNNNNDITFTSFSSQQIRERVNKFEKFIEENDAKRRRAIQKYQTELKLKNQKNGELDVLTIELEQLKARWALGWGKRMGG